MIRLRNQKDFQRVRRAGRAWAHPLLVLNACRNDQPHTRVGVITGKSVGKAVTRNRAKRLLREAVRVRLDAIQPGWDIVLIARRGIVGCRIQQVQAALDELLLRSNLIEEPQS